MKSRPYRRLNGALAGSALAATLLVAPATAALASPQTAQVSTQGCEITGGSMQWGVKESFRSYISGSIANGSWEPSGGVTYETPNFSWEGATGTIDPETGVGTVSFTGTVHFTGHDGILDLTLANPTVEFEGGGKAALLLDAKSTDMEGNVTVDELQEWVGEVKVPAALAPEKDGLQLSSLATTLTNSGAGAFAGFYEAGAELDPITLDLQLAACDTGAATSVPSEPQATPPSPEPAVAAGASVPWIPIAVGGVALFAIGLTTGLLIAGRKKQPGSGDETVPPVTSV